MSILPLLQIIGLLLATIFVVIVTRSPNGRISDVIEFVRTRIARRR